MTETRSALAWRRPMEGRDAEEPFRASTPLELFFDLCFVAAVSFAASSLLHALEDGGTWHALTGYMSVFFAIWWAWMNFTWFASAYDTDDVLYRLVTFVQIAGALVLAAGVPRAFESQGFAVITIGYVIMRLATVSQWLRVAAEDQSHRKNALRYVGMISAVQLGWVLRLALPDSLGMISFAVLVVFELLTPYISENSNPTSWHPEHIQERFSCFTLIVLGEAVLAVTVAMQQAIESQHHLSTVIGLAIDGLVIACSLWWLYFADAYNRKQPERGKNPYLWAYVHYFIFASIAAIGTSFEVVVHHELTNSVGLGHAGRALGIAVAVFLMGVWTLHLERLNGATRLLKPVAAVLAIAAGFTEKPGLLVAVVLLVVAVAGSVLSRREALVDA